MLHENHDPIAMPRGNPYISAATSQNTRRAYQSDIKHFEQWGGRLPSTAETILQYLQFYANSLNPRTLARRLTALKNWHLYQGFSDPTQHPAVSKTLTGIMRIHGKPKDKAPPLLPQQLLLITTALACEDTLRAFRDSALLQLAFFGAFRRSELVNICCEHIDWQEQGIDIRISYSKTDQTNQGQYCAVPFGNKQLCPVQALKRWLERAGIEEGPIFRRIHINGSIDTTPLSPLSVSHILKKRASQAGISHANKLSSHSMRRGLATSASREGACVASIMRQGRWRTVNTLMEYIESAQRFEENAAASVIHKLDATC